MIITRAARWRQIGTNVDVVVHNAPTGDARAAVAATISTADAVLSRFRDDSELSQVNRSAGQRIVVSELLARAIATALDAAERTDGLVDPSVGRVVRLIGYDRDFALMRGMNERVPMQFEAVPGWRAVEWDAERRTLRLPRGVELDLDSTGKALIVDLAVRAAAATLPARAGVLVSIGGDMAVAGQAPVGGWPILLSENSAAPTDGDGPVVSIRSGALATSSTTVRRWRRGGEIAHHLIDPRTARPADGPWRTVTVVAGSCVEANTLSTCAIVQGAAAQDWLTGTGLAARLVGNDGALAYVNGWPADAVLVAAAA